MIHYSAEMPVSQRSRVMNGNGTYLCKELLSKEDTEGRARLFALNTLPRGASIGVHPHKGEGEAYYILQGEALVTEDGTQYTLRPGDAEFCPDGHTHGIENPGETDLVFLAVIMVDK